MSDPAAHIPDVSPDHEYRPVQTIEGIVCGYCKGPRRSPRHYRAHTPDVDTLASIVREEAAFLASWALDSAGMSTTDADAAGDSLLGALSDLAATARYAEREVEAQMQAKLDAQSLLANIVDAIGLSRSDFALDDTWGTVGPRIIERLTEIVACAETAEADRDRLARRVAELENRLNADSQDFEIRCLREMERTLRERVAELKAVLRQFEWLDKKKHNRAGEAWLAFFDEAMRAARADPQTKDQK